MIKLKRWWALLAVLALLAAACGDDDDTSDTTQPPETTTTTAAPTTTEPPETTTTTEPPTTTTTAPPETTTTTEAPMLDLVVWADETRAEAFSTLQEPFAEATGANLVVEIVEFGAIRDQVSVAGPAGEGPDLFIGPHDWTGELAANGSIEPISLGVREGDFFEVALQAFNYEGQLYALPYSTEAIAIYYNTDLVPEPPATFEEIQGICDAAGTDSCLGVPGGGDGGDAYHNYPFVTALGGYIFAYDSTTGFDPSDVGLDNEGAIAGITFLEEQIAAGVVNDTNYDAAKNLFLEGQAPFWMTGPWERGGLDEQEAVNWGVTTIPTIQGNIPQPFVGVNGIFLSAFSENKLLAQTFLLDFVATTDTMRALYDADPRNPALRSVFDQLADDPIAQTFAQSAATGVPMPNISEMGAVWGPLGDNILQVRNGTLGAEEAMTNAATTVRETIEGG